MKQTRDTSWISSALCIVFVLCAYLCLAAIAISLEDGASRGAVLLSYRQQALLNVDELLREERCDRRDSNGNDIPKPFSCISETNCELCSSPSLSAFDFIRPAHAGLLFFLRHIPVRAGPCRSC